MESNKWANRWFYIPIALNQTKKKHPKGKRNFLLIFLRICWGTFILVTHSCPHFFAIHFILCLNLFLRCSQIRFACFCNFCCNLTWWLILSFCAFFASRQKLYPSSVLSDPQIQSTDNKTQTPLKITTQLNRPRHQRRGVPTGKEGVYTWSRYIVSSWKVRINQRLRKGWACKNFDLEKSNKNRSWEKSLFKISKKMYFFHKMFQQCRC